MAHFLDYKNSRIHYYLQGKGPALLFCLHGFGNDGSSFSFLSGSIGNQFTSLAIDLPFHGKTIWKEGLLFTSTDLFEITRQITVVCHLPFKKISLLGFSLGGRLALSFFQDYPQLFSRMALLAPDGLRMNGWYWFGTQTWIGNKWFRFSSLHPAWLFRLTRFCNRLGLVKDHQLQLVHYYLGNPASGTALYQRWMTMRKFKPQLRQVSGLTQSRQVPVKMLFGQHDQLIRYGEGNRWAAHSKRMIRVKIIAAGHRLLQPKYLPEILELLG